MIVDPTARGHGVGRALARDAVLASLELGLTKLVVEVMADQEVTIAMFRSLGFDPEALLEDHVRDSSGELHDLMILSHSVEESWASMLSTGIVDSDYARMRSGDDLRVADVIRERRTRRPTGSPSAMGNASSATWSSTSARTVSPRRCSRWASAPAPVSRILIAPRRRSSSCSSPRARSERSWSR